MSNTNGVQTLAKSMNGIITLSDGSGTVIQNGTITSSNIDSTTTLTIGANYGVTLGSITAYARTPYTAVLPTDIVNLTCLNNFSTDLLTKANIWTLKNTFTSGIITNLIQSITTTANLIIGSNLTSAGSIVIGAVTSLVTRIGSIKITDNTLDAYTTGILNLGTTTANQIILGSSAIPPRTPYTALSGNDLVNYNTMLTFTSGTVLTAANNIFTGTYNKFNNFLYCNNFQALSGIINLGTLASVAGVTIGTSAITVYVGAVKFLGNVIDSATVGVFNIGSTNATSMIIGNSTCDVGIRTKHNLVIGPNVTPSSVLPVSYAGPCLEITNSTTNSIIDFHSSATVNDYDARIMSQGGGSVSSTGAMTIQAGTININPSGNLTMGSSTSTNTFIQNTDGLIIGTNPTSYNPAGGTMLGQGIRLTSYNNVALLDFHSNTVGSSNYDSRIISINGTTTVEQGTLNLASGTVNVTSNVGNITLTSNSGSINLTGTNNCILEVGVSSGNCLLDFHSNTTSINDFDARILCNGASSGGSGTGQMSYSASNHYFTGQLRANSGLSFGKGNLQSASLLQSGSNNPNLNVGAGNALVIGGFNFQDAFSVGPQMNISVYTNTPASMGLICTVTSVSTSSFTVNVYNSRNVTAPAGTWGFQWMAIGSY